MEFTEKGVPLSLKPAFQEYDIHQLDPERDAFTIIERTLARGHRDEVCWLFTCFGTEQLAEWVHINWRILPQRYRSFWHNYFDLSEEMDEMTAKFVSGEPIKRCPASCPVQFYRTT